MQLITYSSRMKPAIPLILFIVILVVVAATGCTSAPHPIPAGPPPSQAHQSSSIEQFLDIIIPQLQTRLDIADEEVNITARVLGITGVTGHASDVALLSLVTSDPWFIDAVTVSPDGTIVAVMPAEYQGVVGEDISNQSHIVTILKDQEPALSPIFTTVEGFVSAAIAYPVFSPGGELTGGVSAPFDPALLIGPVISHTVNGTPYSVTVTQTDGLILFDTDPSQIGKSPDDPIYAQFPELKAVMQRSMIEPQGNGTYTFTKPGTNQMVRKEAVWSTISLHGTGWRVIVQEQIGS
jgi:hypothetical protein